MKPLCYPYRLYRVTPGEEPDSPSRGADDYPEEVPFMRGMEKWPGTPDRKRLDPEDRVPEPVPESSLFLLSSERGSHLPNVTQHRSD